MFIDLYSWNVWSFDVVVCYIAFPPPLTIPVIWDTLDWFIESRNSLVLTPPAFVPLLREIFLSESKLKSPLNFAWKPNPPSPKWVFLIYYWTNTFWAPTPRLSIALTYLLTGLLWLLLVRGLIDAVPSWILYSFLTLLPLFDWFSTSLGWEVTDSLFHIKFAKLLLCRNVPFASIYSIFYYYGIL